MGFFACAGVVGVGFGVAGGAGKWRFFLCVVCVCFLPVFVVGDCCRYV